MKNTYMSNVLNLQKFDKKKKSGNSCPLFLKKKSYVFVCIFMQKSRTNLYITPNQQHLYIIGDVCTNVERETLESSIDLRCKFRRRRHRESQFR